MRMARNTYNCKTYQTVHFLWMCFIVCKLFFNEAREKMLIRALFVKVQIEYFIIEN